VRDRNLKSVFIHSAELEKLSYPPGCPFNAQRAGKTRDLLISLGLLGKNDIRVIAPKPATRVELEIFHSARYLDEIQLAAQGRLTKKGSDMGLGAPDCPVFSDMYQYAALACGATLTSAELILSGEADITFNPSGGFHHAKAEFASGFCYFNDVVLGSLRLTQKGKRVLFVDIDAHHCDGVQDAFYSSSDVMVISLHESGKTLFPWTGFENEIGEGAGRGFNVNVPLPVGIFDEAYMTVFNEIAMPLVKAYQPDVIILELGMDALAGDPLVHLGLTNNAYVEIIDQLMSFKIPILATGGGGYDVEKTVRGWALAWKTLSGGNAEPALNIGLGGVMLQSEEWSGGLRDRVLPVDEKHRRSINSVIRKTINAVKNNIFGYHGIEKSPRSVKKPAGI
jgi:acetoin utilization protein AcuC